MSFREIIHALLTSNPEAIRVAVERAPRPQTLWVETLQVGDRTVERVLVVECGLAF